MKKNGLSQEALKLIACVTMLLDHIGAALLPQHGWLRAIGRIAFPIYCFLLAEGFHYTRNRKKYGLRLLAGMLLSELPFDLLFYGRIYWGYQSVMVTLFIAFLMLCFLEKIPNLGLKCLAVLPFCLLAELMYTDYGGAGVLMVAFFYLTREIPRRLPVQTVGLILLCWLIGGYQVVIGPIRFPLELLGVLAMVPIGLYAGKKSTSSKVI